MYKTVNDEGILKWRRLELSDILFILFFKILSYNYVNDHILRLTVWQWQ